MIVKQPHNVEGTPVLVVEDDPTSRFLLCSDLERWGYTTLQADDGDGAIALLTAERGPQPQLVLLDWSMPGKSGLEVVTAIRRLQSAQWRPYIIMVTSHNQSDDVVTALNTGADDFITKPYDPGVLRARVAVGQRMVDLQRSVREKNQQVERSERDFQTLIDNAPDVVFLHREGRCIYGNVAARKLAGRGPDTDLTGVEILSLLHPEDVVPTIERIDRFLSTGVRTLPNEVRFRQHDGTYTTVETTGVAVSFEGKPAVLVFARDVTKRKELADKMIQMDRVIAIGSLAAGVDHEINNPLSYVSGNVRLALEGIIALQRDPVDADALSAGFTELVSLLTEAAQGTHQITKICRDLRGLARERTEPHGPCDISAVIEAAVRVTDNQVRYRANLERSFAPVPPVLGSSSKLTQVFINLLVNAAQSIHEGAAQANRISIRTVAEPDWVQIEISDTGVGVEPEHLERVFEPFHTTKDVGQGTGLGLAICRQIVTAHQGEITMVSTMGVGSVVRVRLPTMAAPSLEAAIPAPELTAAPAQVAPQPSRRRVLVVDDDVLVARLLKRRLGKRHDVTVAHSGAVALALLSAGERYDVIFSDLMMPEMTGMELHAHVLERWPAIAESMVFLTGGVFTAAGRAFFDRVTNRRFYKPFSMQELDELVQASR